MDWLSWVIVAVCVAWFIYDKLIKPGMARTKEKPEQGSGKRESYANCYQAKYLLTKNEWYAHKKLKQLADTKGLIICPKVRLLDIIEPRKGEKDYKSLFYKIQAKHVDFLICDQAMHIKGIVELDDSSHDQKDRQERDQFVDEILTSVGYKVIHTRSITDNTLDAIAPQTEEAKAEETA